MERLRNPVLQHGTVSKPSGAFDLINSTLLSSQDIADLKNGRMENGKRWWPEPPVWMSRDLNTKSRHYVS